MPFSSARLALLALILLAAPFLAPVVATASDDPVAIEIPANADILITDGRGVIVGAGEADGGTTFRLALVEGFSGPATLIFVLDDGSFQEIEVMIDAGGVSIGDRRLGDLVAGAFAHVAIGRETPGSRPLGEASEADDGVDDGPGGVPPVATPPAASPAAGASGDGDAGGEDSAPSPPVEAGPADEGAREPAPTEAPPSDLPAGDPSSDESSRGESSRGESSSDESSSDEPAADAPSADRPPEDEGPSESPDDAPDRGRP